MIDVCDSVTDFRISEAVLQKSLVRRSWPEASLQIPAWIWHSARHWARQRSCWALSAGPVAPVNLHFSVQQL